MNISHETHTYTFPAFVWRTHHPHPSMCACLAPCTTSPDSFFSMESPPLIIGATRLTHPAETMAPQTDEGCRTTTPVPLDLTVSIVHWRMEINSVTVLVHKRRAAFKFSDHLEQHSTIQAHTHPHTSGWDSSAGCQSALLIRCVCLCFIFIVNKWHKTSFRFVFRCQNESIFSFFIREWVLCRYAKITLTYTNEPDIISILLSQETDRITEARWCILTRGLGGVRGKCNRQTSLVCRLPTFYHLGDAEMIGTTHGWRVDYPNNVRVVWIWMTFNTRKIQMDAGGEFKISLLTQAVLGQRWVSTMHPASVTHRAF